MAAAIIKESVEHDVRRGVADEVNDDGNRCSKRPPYAEKFSIHNRPDGRRHLEGC